MSLIGKELRRVETVWTMPVWFVHYFHFTNFIFAIGFFRVHVFFCDLATVSVPTSCSWCVALVWVVELTLGDFNWAFLTHLEGITFLENHWWQIFWWLSTILRRRSSACFSVMCFPVIFLICAFFSYSVSPVKLASTISSSFQ